MTIDQVVVKYIYQFGKLSLQGLGTFELTEQVPEAEYIQKHKQIPVTGLKFSYLPKVETDPEFISFYAEQRGKIASLSVSDIYTYLQMTTQLLNIGNPYEWKGLGTLNKINNGTLVLEPGYYVSFRDVEGAPAKLRERAEKAVEKHSYIDEPEESGLSAGTRKILMVLVILLALGLAGWFGYRQYFGGGSNAAISPADSSAASTTLPSPADTLVTQAPVASAPISAPPVLDSFTVVPWKGVLNEANTKEAGLAMVKTYSRMASKIFVETTDSLNFKAYVVVNYAPKDTAKAVDSLRRFFARPVKLELLPAQ